MLIFKAKVVRGEGRGKKIGYPTINLDPVNFNMDYGVYLVGVVIGGKKHKGLLHFGRKKTFGKGLSAEAHLVDFNLEVCPENVIIKVVKKIRNVKKFKDVEELKKQIGEDIKTSSEFGI